MGILDQAMLQQAKKAQGETNQRLEALITEQQRTNQLLAQLVQLLAQQQSYGQPPQGRPPHGPASWGAQG